MKKIFVLDEIDCPNCAAKFEHAVKSIDGVQNATVSFFAQKLILEADDDNFEAIVKQVVKTAKKVVPDCKIVL